MTRAQCDSGDLNSDRKVGSLPRYQLRHYRLFFPVSITWTVLNFTAAPSMLVFVMLTRTFTEVRVYLHQNPPIPAPGVEPG